MPGFLVRAAVPYGVEFTYGNGDKYCGGGAEPSKYTMPAKHPRSSRILRIRRFSNHELVALIFRRLQAYLDYCSTGYDNRVLVHQRTGFGHHWEGSSVHDGEPNCQHAEYR